MMKKYVTPSMEIKEIEQNGIVITASLNDVGDNRNEEGDVGSLDDVFG